MISTRLTAVALGVLLVGCASPRAAFQIRLPAEIDVGDIDRVAVAEFDGLHDTGRLVSATLTEGIVEAGRFRIFEREKLEEILDERDFSHSAVVDPETASELLLVGVDALIFGVVDAYGVDDQTGITQVETVVSTGETETVVEEGEDGELHEVTRDVTKTVYVDRKYVLREGTMGVTFRMADIHTGEIVAIKAETAHFSERAWAEDRRSLPAKDVILDRLARDVCGRFLRQIQPRWVARHVAFEKNDIPETEVGIRYAQSGLWDDAGDAFRQAVATHPSEPTARYNLGLAWYAAGDYRAAAGEIEHAIALDPKDTYIRTLARVRSDAAEVGREWRMAERP